MSHPARTEVDLTRSTIRYAKNRHVTGRIGCFTDGRARGVHCLKLPMLPKATRRVLLRWPWKACRRPFRKCWSSKLTRSPELSKGQSAGVTLEPCTCDWCTHIQQVEELVGRKGRQNSKTVNSITYYLFEHEDARAAEGGILPANALPVSTSKSSGIRGARGRPSV